MRRSAGMAAVAMALALMPSMPFDVAAPTDNRMGGRDYKKRGRHHGQNTKTGWRDQPDLDGRRKRQRQARKKARAR